MTNYINWMAANQPIKGDVLQMQGNPVGDHESPASGVASGVAPSAAQYAMVWSTVNCTVAVNSFKPGPAAALAATKTIALPANVVLEIPNIEGLVSTITMTDL